MATITARTGARSWATATDWVGDACPADNTDSAVIPPDCSMLMNQDQSAWTGLLGVTIQAQGAGSAPGMLYWKNATSGYLKLKTGCNIAGNSATNKGRLLANSDGVWGNTGALAQADKAVILLEGTAKIDALYLDIALYATHPTNWFVETYKTAYGPVAQATAVTPDDDYIDWGTAPPSAGTAVRVKSSGTLPTGLSADDIYYVRSVSSNKCKLAFQNSDITIVNITAVGSGNITMYDGHTDTATKTINCIQNVTADTPWVTTAGHNRVALCDIGPAPYDIQRDTLTTINAGSLVITAANVDSAQYPLARIYLISRNVSIRSAGTTAAQPIVDYGAGTHGGIFSCEICNTAGSGATQYGYGINRGVGVTVSGIIGYCNIGVLDAGLTLSGAVVCCTGGCTGNSSVMTAVCALSSSGIIHGGAFGTYKAIWTVEGQILGCTYGVQFPGTSATIAGSIVGCDSGIYQVNGNGIIVSGAIRSCTTGIYRSAGILLTGTISGCSTGIYESSQCTTSQASTISGCTTGVAVPYTSEFAGVIKGCATGINLALASVGYGSCLLSGAVIGGTGVGVANTTDIVMTNGIVTGWNSTLGSTGGTQVGTYKGYDYPANITIRDLGGVDEALGCWSGGGNVKTTAGQHILMAENNAYYTWLAIPFRAVANQAATVTIVATSTTTAKTGAWVSGKTPLFAIVDPAIGWEGTGEVLDSYQIPDDEVEHTDVLTTTPDHDCDLCFLVRAKGGNAGGTGTIQCSFTFDIATGGGAAAGTRAWASAG
jgi:hypothetical protein